MAIKKFAEDYHVAFGKSAIADFAMTSAVSDVVNAKNFHSTTFLVHWGVGTTGTITITVEACDDVTPSNVTALPFHYRVITGAIDAGDTAGAITAATTTGFTTTAGSHQIVVVMVDNAQLGDTGYGYIRCKCTEVVDSPLIGGIITLQGRPRLATDTTTLT
jgi:hypothetical protein